MYKITTFSNRLYIDENTISKDSATLIDNNIIEFDRILFAVYNICLLSVTDVEKYKKILGNKSLYLYVKETYDLNSYYANSIVQLAQGKVDSQKELQSLYIRNTKAKIATKESTISKEKKILGRLCKMAKRISEYRVKCRDGKKAKLTPVKGLDYIKIKDGIIQVKKHNSWEICSLSKLEYEYIYPEIRKHRNLLGKYVHRLHNLEAKLERLKTLKPIIFGTKVYMQEYSVGKHSRLDFLKHKYKSYEVSGKCDFKPGNMMIRPEYNVVTGTITFLLTLINGTTIKLEGMRFPYRQKELLDAIKFDRNKDKKGSPKNGIAIGCRVTRRYDEHSRCYYQITTMFDIEPIHPYINYSKDSGIVALDFNLGHIDLTELDSKGNLLGYKTYNYTLTDNKEVNIRSLNKILDNIGEYTESKHKILAAEDLDITELKDSFNMDKTKQKLSNKYIHMFPYRRFLDKVKFLKIKFGFDIELVNPAFTSIIGELKYADEMKLNSHIAASYVIGRRALEFKDFPRLAQCLKLVEEKPLKEYKSNWSMWSTLNKMKTA